MNSTPRVAFTQDGTLTVAGPDGPLALRWRRSTRARRLCLRAGAHGLELVVPNGAALAEAGAFAAGHTGWIARQTARAPVRAPVAPGGIIPIAGIDHRIVHRSEPGARGPRGERVIWPNDGALHVRGDPAHLPRRVEDWLRAEARRRCADAARTKAERIGRTPARIAVRDTASRWGSCASSGALSFCWRLIMAPPWTLDYVVAHEVAHLRHMHHGPAFWRVCASLVDAPDLSPDQAIRRARAWLRREGPALHALRFRE